MTNEYCTHQINAFVTYFSWCDLMTREENLKAIIYRIVKFISEFIKQKWFPHCNLRLLHFQWIFRFYGSAQSRSYFFGKSKVSVVTGEGQVSELNKSLLYIAQPNFGQFERLEMHSIGCLCRSTCLQSLHYVAGVVYQNFAALLSNFTYRSIRGL